jgi:predicted DNA-binding antitoxin AbrB/MazE fold protein
MTYTVEAIYENGVLKPVQPLPLREHERVRVSVETIPDAVRRVRETSGLIPCADPALIEWAATDSELDFPSREEP